MLRGFPLPAALLLVLCCARAEALDVAFSGYLDARLIAPTDQQSWVKGGLGKFRFGGGNGNARFVEAVGEANATLLDDLSAQVSARIEPTDSSGVDLLEAYQLYAPRPAGAFSWSVKAGAFFPTISLTAVAGFASNSLTSLFARDAFAWSTGSAISLPIFDAGARRGNLETVEAQRDAALATYQKTIQTAFREVADALARRGTIDDQVKAQADLAAAARDSYFLADARYREGVDPFLSSLDAQRTLYAARRSLASIRRVRADNLVELYRALGGSS
jgi:multidrug efflux system outer membrane protein